MQLCFILHLACFQSSFVVCQQNYGKLVLIFMKVGGTVLHGDERTHHIFNWIQNMRWLYKLFFIFTK